ncbi:MAG TPA: MBL fold metallo-hydrolase [Leptospiraceae bacterium]|nr:MBL fold metallo-hydrolase [Leptospiraceae bacterium]
MFPAFQREIQNYLQESEIRTIDCRYIKENLAASFLIQEGNECAFVETNTVYAVPYLLKTLEESGRKPEDVKYIIVTHVHLDHAGGTSELLKHCPKATVLAHPKTASHLTAPERLVQSSITVYGEEKFRELYGNIEPVPEKRIRIMKDGEELVWGRRKLRFIYTRGHANHHFVIYDSKSNSVFTGDSFGIAYPSLRNGKNIMIFPTTTPTDFEPDEAKKSFDLIAETGAEKAYLTHFGPITDLKSVSELLKQDMEEIRKSCIQAEKDNISDENLQSFFEEFWKEFFNKKADQTGIERKTVLAETALDAGINAMGLAFYIRRLRKKKNDSPA